MRRVVSQINSPPGLLLSSGKIFKVQPSLTTGWRCSVNAHDEDEEEEEGGGRRMEGDGGGGGRKEEGGGRRRREEATEDRSFSFFAFFCFF